VTQPRTLRTRARLLSAALDLFEAQGFEATTVAQIAEAAGVSQMTFFRHFPTKESVVVTDPYDPLIAAAVVAQPRGLPPIERVRLGFLVALARIDAVEGEEVRRRVALAARTPALRAATGAGTHDTEDAVADALVADGADPLEARVAAAACVAAMTAALLAWPASATSESLGEIGRRALDHLALAGTTLAPADPTTEA